MSYEGVIDPDSAAALASTALDGATGASARAAASAAAADTSAKGAAASLAAVAKLLAGLGLPVRWTGTVLQVVLPDGTYTIGVDLQGPEGPVGPAPSIRVGTVTEGEFAVIREAGSPDAAPVLDFVLPRGLAAWTPVPAAVLDGARCVLQIIDWTGGQGTKPATGLYIGATGLVAALASAVDFRGFSASGTVTHIGSPAQGHLAVFGSDGDHIGDGGALTAFGASLVAAAGAVAVKQLLAIVAGDVSGLGSLATQGAGAVAITGGAVDGTPIGATTPAAGRFTTLQASTPIPVSSGGLGTGTAGGGALDNVLGIPGVAGGGLLTRTGAGSYSFTASATFEQTANKGQANGYAQLGPDGKLPTSIIPSALLTALEFAGTWDASANSPALASGAGTKGAIYVVATAGTTALDGIASWNVGDWTIFDGAKWRKLDGLATEVISVASLTGVITAAALKAALAIAAGDVSGLAPVATSGSYNDLTNKPAAVASGAPQIQGRLTLTSGTPVLTSSVTGAGTVYFTPYGGSSVALWNGSAFAATSFAELSQALSDTTKSPSAAAAASVYDLFVWSDGGTIRLSRGPAWSAGATAGSSNARGSGAGSTALTRVQGVLVNAVAIANGPAAGYGTYVGTIATDAAGATVSMNFGGSAAGGSPARLGVWNAHNRRAAAAAVYDTTSSHTYNSATVRPYNNSTNNAIISVVGAVEDAVDVAFHTVESDSQSSLTAPAARIGIAVNSTTVNSATQSAVADSTGMAIVVGLKTLPPLGLSTYQATEASPSGATISLFDNNNAALTGTFMQ